MSLRENLLSQIKPLIEPTKFGESDVFVRGIRADELATLQAFKESDESERLFTARLLALTICDQEGNRIFTEDDVEFLCAAPFMHIQDAFNRAVRLNGLQRAAQEKN